MEVKATEVKIKTIWGMGYVFFPKISRDDPQGKLNHLRNLPSQPKTAAKDLLRRGLVSFKSE